MEVFKKIWAYLTFQKDNAGDNKYLKMMHGINRISLIMAFIAILILMSKCL